MAEFLVLDRESRTRDTNGLTQKELDRYMAWYKSFDIVEVREDSYWRNRGYGNHAFALVKVPGLSLRDAARYMAKKRNLTGVDTNRQYQLNLHSLRVPLRGNVTITQVQFANALVDKSIAVEFTPPSSRYSTDRLRGVSR